ncbi:MAG: patatin-like phospholipase family protein [Bacteroidales bacterium]|nr:patatin-like phospholipase family protein [Bacteroidales bacterium]
MNKVRFLAAGLLTMGAAISAPAFPVSGTDTLLTEGQFADAASHHELTDTTVVRRHQSVGLVLSGGGAKGIAHIGVIKALEDNEIPIDYIAGTSMGAIVGAFYAMGYTPEEMLQLIKSREFSYWSTGQIDPSMVYYFTRRRPTPALFHIPVARKAAADSTNAVPASIINPNPMSFGFMELFSPFNAQCGGDFNKLFVPFRCVASDVEGQHKVVHSKGPLGDAVRSSMSFPIVFQPIRMNGALLYDGGIYDNFPFDVMTADFAPDIMIGVDVSTPTTGPQTSLFDQVDNLVTRQQSYDLPADKGIRVRVDLHRFGLLDFPKAQAIYTIGYNRAIEMMDSIKSRVQARRPALTVNTARGAFRCATPYLRFDSLSVTGASESQNRYIAHMFRPRHDADTFGIDKARQAFYRALSPGRLSELNPQAVYNPSSGLFTLNLRAIPKENFNIGVGGYITSSTSSYLFFSAGYRTLSFSSVSANVNGWIGQSFMGATLNATLNLATRIPSSIGFSAVADRQKFYESDQLFFQDKMPSFIVNRELYGRVDYTLAAGGRGKVAFGLGWGHLADSFYPDNYDVSYKSHRDDTEYNLGQFRVSYTGSTLDNEMFPCAGSSYAFTAMGVTGNMDYKAHKDSPAETGYTEHPRWVQMESVTRNYLDLSRHFSLGLESDVLLSTRKLSANYNATLVNAPAFYPTAAAYNSFNPAMRANSFAAVSAIPIYKYNSNLSARLHLNCFLPVRPIKEAEDGAARWGKWFSTPRFFGEFDVCYTLPFATVSAYVNYASAGSRPWNFGISLGVFILPPKFLR